MKKEIGLWIDQKKAVIFILADEGAEIKRISSELKKNISSSGEAQKEPAGEHINNRLSSDLDSYYDEVVNYICEAESILIFGPGEAKNELKKRLESRKLFQKVVGFETANTMTDNQIVVKVRQRFLT